MDDQNIAGNRPASQPYNEQRYIPRWHVRNPVRYFLNDSGHVHEGETVDISCSGLCLNTSEFLLPNQKIKLIVSLDQERSVELTGRIVWNRASDHGRLAGIELQNVSPEQQETILDYAFELDPEALIRHWFDGWKE